jgi:hypothetical protein
LISVGRWQAALLSGIATFVVCASADAAQLVSPAGGQQLFTERQLLDELPLLQEQVRSVLPAPVIPFEYRLEAGERNPTGIEIVGVAHGAPAPTPNPQRANNLVGDLRGFKPSRNPFYVEECVPSSVSSTGCEQIPRHVPVAAGTYHWHVRPSRAGCLGLAENCLHPWSGQVETFTIPSLLRVNGLRVRPRTRPCATGAVLRYDSTEPSPVVRYRISVVGVRSKRRVLRVSGRSGGKRTGAVVVADGEYQETVRLPLDRVRAGRYRAKVSVTDAVGHRGSARSRKFTVPNPSATCRRPQLRPR